MVRTNLRHFLLVTLLLISNIAITAPTPAATETSTQTAYQQKMQSLQGDLLSIQQIVTPQQFECLKAILGQFQAYTALLLIDETTEEAAINALLAAQGQKASKEDVAQVKQIMLQALEQQQIPLAIAQKFFATLLEMSNVQKQAGVSAHEDADQSEAANSEESTANKKKSRILQAMLGNGPFARLFILDTEKDSTKITAYFEHAKKLEIIPADCEQEALLAQLKAEKDALLSSGTTQAEIQTVFDEIKAQCTLQSAHQIKGLKLPLNFLTLAADKFEALAKELSKDDEEKISVEMIAAKQHELQAQKLVFGITLKEIRTALATIAGQERKAFWRKYGLAALTATTMGTADLLLQTPGHIAKASGSIFNKIFGTSAFYSQEDPSKISVSPAGIWGRLVQLASTIPAGILYKENSFEKLVNTQDPALQMQFAAIGAMYPTLKRAVTVAPFLIQTIPGQKQATVDNAFAEVCSPRVGAASSIAFQKFAPLAAWVVWLKLTDNQELKTAIAVGKSLSQFLIQDDKSNAWNNAAFATAPLVKQLVSAPIDNKIGKLAAKRGVFLRSFLTSGWGSRLVEIAYQTGMRHQLWNQHNGKSENLWVKPDFGKDHKKTTRTTTYTENGQTKERKETFVGTNVPKVNTTPFAPTKVKTKVYDAYMSECTEMSPAEVSRHAPNAKKFWKKDTSIIITGTDAYKSADQAATAYAISSLKNLATEQLAKSAMISACFALNNKIANFGKAAARKAARLALALRLIKKSTHKELESTAKNVQEFVHMGTGLWTFLQSNTQNPHELLQNPEALAQIMDKLAKDGLNAVNPQTQTYQIMVHRMFVDRLYKHLIQNLLHKAIPTWVTEGETSQAGTNLKNFVSEDNWTTKLLGKATNPTRLDAIEKYGNRSATVGKLAIYTTMWLAATTILSYKQEAKKPVKKKTAQPKPTKPLTEAIDEHATEAQPTAPTAVA